MKNATTFKKKELIGEIQKILASQKVSEQGKSVKNSGEKQEDTAEKTAEKPMRRTASRKAPRQERRSVRKPVDYEERSNAASRTPKPVVRGGYTSNLQEMNTVREERRYGAAREDRGNGRDDSRYGRDDWNNGRDDRYSRDDCGNGRDDNRYSRDDRSSGRDDRYSR